jgi:hypothetical protein
LGEYRNNELVIHAGLILKQGNISPRQLILDNETYLSLTAESENIVELVVGHLWRISVLTN